MKKIRILSPAGLMPSEVSAVAAIEDSIPSTWRGYASFYVNDGKKRGMEIDLLLVTADRLLLCELKNWAGHIESDGTNWYQCINNKVINSHASPVGIKRGHAERLQQLLQKDLQRSWGCWYEVHSIVIMCNRDATYEFKAMEKSSVITLAEFLKIKDPSVYKEKLSEISQYQFEVKKRKRPNDEVQIGILDKWLYGTNLKIAKKYITSQSYTIKDINPIFTQKKQDFLYAEYEGQHRNHAHYHSLMRVWDFRNLGSYGFTTENRANLALREFRVQAHVESKFSFIKNNYLLPALHSFDPDLCTEDLVEIYKTTPYLERLDFYLNKISNTKDTKLDILKKLVIPFSSLHNIDVAHRDISLERLWFDPHSKSIIITGLSAAKFPYVDGNKSVTDVYKEILSTSILPLELIDDDFKEHIDPFKIDVFQLGVLSYEILFGKKIYLEVNKLDKNYIEWVEPESIDFNEDIVGWVKKSISLFPDERFKNAQEMLNALDKIIEQEDFEKELVKENIISELEIFKNDIHPNFTWLPIENTYNPDPSKGSIEYRTLIDDKKFIVNIFINLKPIIGKDGENRKILNILKKCRDLSFSNISFPRIKEFGWNIFSGLFIVQEYLDLPRLSSLDIEIITEENIKKISISLLNNIIKLHELGYFHGDLKPDNIIVSQNIDEIILVDLFDVNYNNEPFFNNIYSPNINCTGYERDRFACYKIIREITDKIENLNLVKKEIVQGLGEEENEIPPSLAILKETFDTQLELENRSILKLNIWQKDLKEENFLSDQGKYYFNFYENKFYSKSNYKKKIFDLVITGRDKELKLSLEITKEGLHIDTASIKVVKTEEVINKSITAVRKNYFNAEEVEAFIAITDAGEKNLIDFISELESYKNFISRIFKEETSLKDTSIDKEINSSKLNKLNLAKLWKLMLDSENDLKPNLEIKGKIEYNDVRGLITIPIEPIAIDLSEYSNEQIDVFDIQNNINYGSVNYFLTNLSNGILCVETKFSRRTIEKNRSNLLKLIPKQESSSQFRRKKALDRVLRNEALIPNLIEYFVEGEFYDLNQSDYSIPLPEGEILKIYKDRLLSKQYDAFEYILKNRISVVMGPPGTGKTTLLGHLLDYLNRIESVSRILIVSQSNVAVDELATKARKVIREIATQTNKDPNLALPTIVRLGHKEKVTPELLDIHVDALQSQYRTKFHREFEKRLLTFAPRLHLPKDFIQEAINIYHYIGREIFDYVNARLLAKELKDIINDTSLNDNILKNRYDTVTKQFERLYEVLSNKLKAYSDEPLPILELENPLIYLISDLSYQYKINNPQLISKFIEVLKLSHDWLDRLSTDYGGFASFMANSRKWIVGTLVGIGKPSYQIVDKQYDLVIIDEAGRASANELAMAMQSAKKIVLVGDHLQLPPLYDRKMVKSIALRLGIPKKEVLKTDFERALNVTNGIMLENQFRMAKEIGDIVSEVIYEKVHGKKLLTERGEAPLELEVLAQPWNKVVTWIDTSDQIKLEVNEAKRISNDIEVNIICSLIKDLFKDTIALSLFDSWLIEDENNPTIGVITGYAEQAKKINNPNPV